MKYIINYCDGEASFCDSYNDVITETGRAAKNGRKIINIEEVEG